MTDQLSNPVQSRLEETVNSAGKHDFIVDNKTSCPYQQGMQIEFRNWSNKLFGDLAKRTSDPPTVVLSHLITAYNAADDRRFVTKKGGRKLSEIINHYNEAGLTDIKIPEKNQNATPIESQPPATEETMWHTIKGWISSPVKSVKKNCSAS